MRLLNYGISDVIFFNLIMFASIRSSHSVCDQIRSSNSLHVIKSDHLIQMIYEIQSYIKLSIFNPKLSIENPKKANLLFKNIKKINNEQ